MRGHKNSIIVKRVFFVIKITHRHENTYKFTLVTHGREQKSESIIFWQMLGNDYCRRLTISEILTIPSAVVCNDIGLIFNLNCVLLSNFFHLNRNWCQPLQLQEGDQTPLR